jgi:Short C-terminal domain
MRLTLVCQRDSFDAILNPISDAERRERMKIFRTCITVLIVLVGLNVAGCCTSTKEKEKVIVPAQSASPTLGKELEDLEQAYKKGAITKEEYEAGKKKLLETGAQPAK